MVVKVSRVGTEEVGSVCTVRQFLSSKSLETADIGNLTHQNLLDLLGRIKVDVLERTRSKEFSNHIDGMK